MLTNRDVPHIHDNRQANSWLAHVHTKTRKRRKRAAFFAEFSTPLYYVATHPMLFTIPCFGTYGGRRQQRWQRWRKWRRNVTNLNPAYVRTQCTLILYCTPSVKSKEKTSTGNRKNRVTVPYSTAEKCVALVRPAFVAKSSLSVRSFCSNKRFYYPI